MTSLILPHFLPKNGKYKGQFMYWTVDKKPYESSFWHINFDNFADDGNKISMFTYSMKISDD